VPIKVWDTAALPPDVRKVSDFPKGLSPNLLRLRRRKGRSAEKLVKFHTAGQSPRRTSDGKAVFQISVVALSSSHLALSQNQRSIVSAESVSIAHCNIDFVFACVIGNVIKVAIRVRFVVIDGWRNAVVING
jgi:hypothetical protein